MSAKASELTTNAMPFVTRCRDGYEKTNPVVRAVYQYGWLGPSLLLMGYTALPRRIDFVCPECGQMFGSITEPKELAKFRYREPRPDER
jgi:hypothetical protein